MTLDLPPTKLQPRDWLVMAGLALLSLAAYIGVSNNHFLNFDDDNYVTGNVHVQQGLTWSNIAWAFGPTPRVANWHPVTWISHMIDCQVFGLRPGWHLLENVLWHVANAALLFMLLRRMTGATWRSGAVAGLFALHPLHVESVAWVAERKDVLSTFFALLAIHAYLDFLKQRAAWRYGLLMAWFALGLMSKPMIVTLPFVLLLLDYWPLGRRASEVRGAVIEKVPLLALSIVSCWITVQSQVSGGATSGLAHLSLGARITNAIVTYATYLGQMIWPVNLVVLYPYPETRQTGMIVASLSVLAVVSAAAIMSRRRAPYLLMGWLWYLGTLVPVIGIVQVGEQAHADRYTYWPLIGVFIMVTWAVREVLTSRLPALPSVILRSVCAMLMVVLGVLTFKHVQHWRDSESLFSRAVSLTSNNPTAHNNLGLALASKGRLEDAERHFRETIRLRPGHLDARNNLGNTLAALNKPTEAEAEFRAVLEADPRFIEAHVNYGVLLSNQGRLDQAMEHFNAALSIDPEHPSALNNMGKVHLAQSRFADAEGYYRRVLAILPKSADAHNSLGAALANQGRFDEALAELYAAHRINPDYPGIHYNLALASTAANRKDAAMSHYFSAIKQNPNDALAHSNLATIFAERLRLPEAEEHYVAALRINPEIPDAHRNLANVYLRTGHPRQAMAHYDAYVQLRPDDALGCVNLAMLLLTSPDRSLRDAPRARQLAQHACDLTEAKVPAYVGTLAVALGELGEFDIAVRHAEAALALARNGGSPELIAKIQHDLDRLRAGQSAIDDPPTTQP